MLWNHVLHGGGRPKQWFAGILLQEWDPKARKLIGPVKNIFRGSPLGLVEAPHLYKRGGWYYLTTAEGGTFYDHAITMARSRTIDGPYEMHPQVHPITSKDHPDAPLQRAGHGQIVETPDGLVYHTHLCGRPLPGTRRSPLGRETAIQKCMWRDDGWLYLADGGPVPSVEVEAPKGAVKQEQPGTIRHSFSGKELPLDFQWLRTPEPERIFADREAGCASPVCARVRRQLVRAGAGGTAPAAFSLRVETEVAFSPVTFQQAAGLTHYYNRHKFHFLAVSFDERLGRILTIMSAPAIGRTRSLLSRWPRRSRCPATGRWDWRPRSPARSCSLPTGPAPSGTRSDRCSTPA
jgi:xylan 1,4-beta-xylosidase